MRVFLRNHLLILLNKKIYMKKVKKIFTALLLFILLVFWLWYLTRTMYDLKNTEIKENIVLTLKWKQGLYLLNPNTEKITNFSWSYNQVEQINIDINTKVFNLGRNYYYSIEWVFNSSNIMVNDSWLMLSKFQALWTEDGRYLIRTDGHVVRMLWLFFSTPTVEQVIHIIEPSTKKSKQILLYDESWKLLQVDKIEGYIR